MLALEQFFYQGIALPRREEMDAGPVVAQRAPAEAAPWFTLGGVFMCLFMLCCLYCVAVVGYEEMKSMKMILQNQTAVLRVMQEKLDRCSSALEECCRIRFAEERARNAGVRPVLYHSEDHWRNVLNLCIAAWADKNLTLGETCIKRRCIVAEE